MASRTITLENLTRRDLGETGRRERGGQEEGRSCFWATDGRTTTGSAFTRKVMLAGI